MDSYHAFYESLDAWLAQVIPGCAVFVMQMKLTRPMSKEYNLFRTSHVIQVTQIEHNVAHHACFLVAQHDNLTAKEDQQARADRADLAYEMMLSVLSKHGMTHVHRAKIGIPEDITVTYTYLPEDFLTDQK